MVRLMTTQKKTGVEWVGAIISTPAYVTGEGDPYRPELILWMGPNRTVLGTELEKPGELLGRACESLRNTMVRPLIGRPHVPERVRVASPQLAEALRAGHPEIEIVLAPTPEIDELLEGMRESMHEGAAEEQTFLGPGIEPDAMAAFFRAAAALYRAKPWKTVPSDESLFSVTIEELGLHEVVMSIIGQRGESLGFILFAGIEEFEAYRDSAESRDRGSVPPHFFLNFERGADLAAGLRKEISAHGWEVADANAFPWLLAVDADLVAKPPSAEEVTIAEALCLALPMVLSEKKALLSAWDRGEPVSRTLSVRTHAGELEVILRAPYGEHALRAASSEDLLGALAELAKMAAKSKEEIDPYVLAGLTDELVRRFEAAPEARGLGEVGACRLVTDYAASYFGATIPTLTPAQVREIIFEIIPAKVSIGPELARALIEENRAFFAFLKREFGLKAADRCLRVIAGADAVEKLEAAMSDPRNFGMAKSMFMAASGAGFDMDTEEGFAAFARAMQEGSVPGPMGTPSQGRSPPAGVGGAGGAKKRAKPKVGGGKAPKKK